MIPLSDWLTLVLAGGSWLPGWAEVFLIAASAGAVGMGLSDIASGLSERLSGGDDADQEFGGDDDFAGGDGFEDEEFGEFGDWDGDDGDDLDEWGGDEGLDDFGGDGGGGGQSDLEPRLEELENEVATISSTMGTVRSENEAINETVEDIEDNIRKLLDIYEMVTRGVNPFVDDAQASGGMGGSFGLFEDADDDGFDDLDPDVADADPDSFFDDDFDGDAFDGDEEFDDEDFAPADEEAFDDEALARDGDSESPSDTVAASTSADGESDGGDGKTFEELKSEYESGAAEWDADAEPGDVPSGATTVDEREGATDADDSSPSEDSEPHGDSTATSDVEGDTASVEPSPEAEAPFEERSEATDGTKGEDGSGDGSSQVAHADGTGQEAHASDGKPYLESLPSGYGAELLVIEWLSYLRGRSSTSEALRAINYYQNIGWIGTRAASSLQEYLSGLAGEEVTPTSASGTQLTIDHHTDSLRYIGELGGKHVDVERLEWSGSGRDGSRMERRGPRGIQR